MLSVFSSAVVSLKAKGQKIHFKKKQKTLHPWFWLYYHSYVNDSFSFNLSRLYDHATMIRHAVLKTMNETRVSLPSLKGLSLRLPLCHEAYWSLLWDWGLQDLVAGLARILVGITIHSHKATLCPFSVTKLLWSAAWYGMSFTLCGMSINYSPRATWSAYHPRQQIGSWFAEICT